MKAIISRNVGGPDALEFGDLPTPVAGPGEVLVRVLACGVNFPDVLVIEDKYQRKPPRPFAPGGEISGVVEALGEGVTTWKKGDRILSTIGDGGMAEYAIVKADNAYALPGGRDAAEGAGFLLTYATTIHGLVDRGHLKKGETLLVLGAAGGLGISAIEIGKALGATVVAAVSNEEKAEAAKQAGADRVLIYDQPHLINDPKALSQAFKDAVGESGANVIYDPVGGHYAEPALRSIAWEGRYLVVGFPAGIPKIPLNLALLKSCDIVGVFWGGFVSRNPNANKANIEQLFRWWEEGKIHPHIGGRWPLAKGAEAIRWLGERKAIGKGVVIVSEG